MSRARGAYTYTTMQGFIGAVSKQYELSYGYCVKELNKITRKTAREMAAAIADRSPRDTGRYALGWVTSELVSGYRSADGSLTMVVHNKDRYQLTHLLERDHFAGKDMHLVRGFEHIAPAEEKYNALYIERITKAFEAFGG